MNWSAFIFLPFEFLFILRMVSYIWRDEFLYNVEYGDFDKYPRSVSDLFKG